MGLCNKLRTIVLFSCIVLQFNLSNGLKLEGRYRGSSTWHFIEKYCFLPRKAGEDKGAIQGSFYFPVDKHPSPSMMLYFKGEDENASEKKEWGAWEKAYLQPRTCEEKHQIATSNGMVFNLLHRNSFRKFLHEPRKRTITEYNINGNSRLPVNYFEQIFTPASQHTEAPKVPVIDRFGNMSNYWRVDVLATMNTVRPRWFFVTVGNCEPDCVNKTFCANSINMQWDLNMTNGNSHFSADESFTLELSIVFLILALAINLAALKVRFSLSKLRKFHASVGLLCLSAHCTLIATGSQYSYLAYYGETGKYVSNLWAIAMFFQGMSEIALLSHVILVAKGWTIVRRKISAVGRIKVAVFLTTYLSIYFACIVYYATFLDKGEITYMYDTPPGLILTILRVAAFFWFTYSVHVTLKKYNQKKGFYRKYWFFISLWLLSLPLFVTLNSAIDIWARAKVMYLLQGLAQTAVLSILIGLYNPMPLCGRMGNSSFPFHATTIAMLRNRNSSIGKGNKSFDQQNGDSEDIFLDYHLDRATELSQSVRHALSVIQNHTSDLFAFLDELQHERAKVKGGNNVDLEKGQAHPPGERPDETAGANSLLSSIPARNPRATVKKDPTVVATPYGTKPSSATSKPASTAPTPVSSAGKPSSSPPAPTTRPRRPSAGDNPGIPQSRRNSGQRGAPRRGSKQKPVAKPDSDSDDDALIGSRKDVSNKPNDVPGPPAGPTGGASKGRRLSASSTSSSGRRPSAKGRRPSTAKPRRGSSGSTGSAGSRSRPNTAGRQQPSNAESSDEDDELLGGR